MPQEKKIVGNNKAKTKKNKNRNKKSKLKYQLSPKTYQKYRLLNHIKLCHPFLWLKT
jgi:hypothetical protein